MEYSPWAPDTCVMFVEEDKAVSRRMRDVLEEEGFKVLSARNSVEALVIAADYPFSIDVLITGTETRVAQNGLELAACFRILRPESGIILTAGRGAGKPAMTVGFEGEAVFLAEPFTRHTLAEAIARSLQNSWQPAVAA